MATYEATLPPASGGKGISQKWLSLAASDGRLRNLLDSILLEHRIPERLWVQIHATVEAAPDFDVVRALRDWARKNILMGPTCGYFVPLLRVVTFEDFWRSLVTQADGSDPSVASITEYEARELVQELCDPVLWTRAVRRASDLGLNMAQYVAWATYDPSGRTRHAGLPLSVVHIAASLGFDSRDDLWRKLPLLLLSYTPNSVDFVGHFPTVVEALATDPINYYFSVAPPGSEAGLTRVWPDAPTGVVPRPEIVHSPLPLSVLNQRIVAVHA